QFIDFWLKSAEQLKSAPTESYAALAKGFNMSADQVQNIVGKLNFADKETNINLATGDAQSELAARIQASYKNIAPGKLSEVFSPVLTQAIPTGASKMPEPQTDEFEEE